jgi:hypothetical protein
VFVVAPIACGEPDELVVREGEQTEAFCDANCTRGLECGGRGPLDACKADREARVTGLEPDAARTLAYALRDDDFGVYVENATGETAVVWRLEFSSDSAAEQAETFTQNHSGSVFRSGSRLGFAISTGATPIDWALVPQTSARAEAPPVRTAKPLLADDPGSLRARPRLASELRALLLPAPSHPPR